MTAMRNSSGFTLAELMIVAGLVGILSAIAVPAIVAEMPRYRLNGASRQVMSDLLAARMQAVSENNEFMVSFDVNNHQYTILDDDDNDGSADAGEIATTKDLYSEYPEINFSSTRTLTFIPDGTVSNSGSLTVASSSDSRTVDITGAGRIRIP